MNQHGRTISQTILSLCSVRDSLTTCDPRHLGYDDGVVVRRDFRLGSDGNGSVSWDRFVGGSRSLHSSSSADLPVCSIVLAVVWVTSLPARPGNGMNTCSACTFISSLASVGA